MKEETIKEAQMIIAVVADAKKYSRPFNAVELFHISEDLISKLAFFISPLLEAESEYRREVLKYRETGESASGAELKAKAGNNYIFWKKLQYIYDLAQEQIMLVKKFADKLEYEHRNT